MDAQTGRLTPEQIEILRQRDLSPARHPGEDREAYRQRRREAKNPPVLIRRWTPQQWAAYQKTR